MTDKTKKAISSQIDRWCKDHGLIAVFVYITPEGDQQIISRSESPIDSAHILMSAAEHLHMMDTDSTDPMAN